MRNWNPSLEAAAPQEPAARDVGARFRAFGRDFARRDAYVRFGLVQIGLRYGLRCLAPY